MKAKQLPGSLDEWLKTPTVVIGGVNWLEANLHVLLKEPATRRANRSGRHSQRLSTSIDGASSCHFSNFGREA
jgi:hypothetical protein